MKSSTLLMILAMITGCSINNNFKRANMILYNGVVVTLDETRPSATAIAIKDDKIIVVGTDDEINQYKDDKTHVIDLDGKFVMPGFIESHAHFVGLGESLVNIDLRVAKNWVDVIKIVRDAAESLEPEEWIIGRGWHQDKLNPKPVPSVNGYPVHDKLSNAVPNNPVMLSHASGHAIFANAKAMALAGITNQTPNPEGGTIVKDKNGNPIGVFEENAENLIRNIYQEYLNKRNKEQIRNDNVKKINLAVEECLKKGITSFHDAGETFDIIDLMKELADSNKLKIRLNVMIGESLENMKKQLSNYKIIGYANNHLTVRSIKQYIDGALGSRGAWMIEPYEDLPSHNGSNVTPISTLKEIAKLAIENDFQLRIHAIGDRGNREVLNIYEEAFKNHPIKTDLRWSIEHAQHLSTEDIPRFGKLGVIAAMQSIHCTSDASFVPVRIGQKRSGEGAYVWRKLIDTGAVIANGTDSPVEDVDPIKCLYAAVTRKQENGSQFYPEQKMTRMEALKSYTINGAYASFEENIKGTLKPGMLADIVILSNDLLNCTEDEMLNTKVHYTIVGGKILYKPN